MPSAGYEANFLPPAPPLESGGPPPTPPEAESTRKVTQLLPWE